MRIPNAPVVAALLILAGGCLARAANAQVVSIEGPAPQTASCSNFDRVRDGVWAPNGAMLVNGHIILGPGARIAPDTDLEGVKLGAWLNTHCPNPVSGPVGPFAGHCGGWRGGCDSGVNARMP